MTNKEAIEALTSKEVCNSEIMLEALDVAIKALKQYGVLQEIRREIADRAQWHYSHNQEDVATIISCEALEIIDKHIKEIEE